MLRDITSWAHFLKAATEVSSDAVFGRDVASAWSANSYDDVLRALGRCFVGSGNINMFLKELINEMGPMMRHVSDAVKLIPFETAT